MDSSNRISHHPSPGFFEKAIPATLTAILSLPKVYLRGSNRIVSYLPPTLRPVTSTILKILPLALIVFSFLLPLSFPLLLLKLPIIVTGVFIANQLKTKEIYQSLALGYAASTVFSVATATAGVALTVLTYPVSLPLYLAIHSLPVAALLLHANQVKN